MTDIKNYETFVKIKPITKGLSGDKKYCVETDSGKQLFLRISDVEEYDRKKAEYNMMEHVHTLGFITPQPIDFGLCNSGKSVYSISDWIDGKDAEKLLPAMLEAEQYILGVKTGETLQKIHSLPVPEYVEPWNNRFDRKVRDWIGAYKSKPQIHSDIGEIIVCYLESRRCILDSRLQTFIHGDYNIENIIVTPSGKIWVIDFNSYNLSYGDPWWDIDNMSWMPVMFPYFYIGQIKGYFNGEPPTDFWNVLTYYLAYDALAALTDPYGLNGIEDGSGIVNNILKWTDNFNNPVPTWYLKDFYV